MQESCQVNVENEFRNLAQGAWNYWSDFERDLAQFENNSHLFGRKRSGDVKQSPLTVSWAAADVRGDKIHKSSAGVLLYGEFKSQQQCTIVSVVFTS